MSVPGLRSGSGHNPHTRMPNDPAPPVHKTHYTEDDVKVTKDLKKVRTRGRVMGTPGKIPADIYANVIKAKQRARRNPNTLGSRQV